MKFRAHISLRHLEHLRHSCIHTCNAFPTEQGYTMCRMRGAVTWNQPDIVTPILSLTSLCYKQELQLGLPLISSVFTKWTLASLWGTQQHCILMWISLQSQMGREDSTPSSGILPPGPQRMNIPECYLNTCLVKRLPESPQGSGFSSQPRPLLRCTNSRCRELVTWNMALSDWLLFPPLRCRNLTNFYIFLRASNSKLDYLSTFSYKVD